MTNSPLADAALHKYRTELAQIEAKRAQEAAEQEELRSQWLAQETSKLAPTYTRLFLAKMGLPADSELGQAARGSTLNLVGAAVSAVATFALTVVVTHGASKVEAGVFFATTSLFIIATSIGQLGTNTGLVYFVARAVESRERRLLPSYVRTALVPVLVCAAVMALVLFVGAPEIARVTNPTQREAATRSLRALALLVPFVGLENVLLSATRGLGPNIFSGSGRASSTTTDPRQLMTKIQNTDCVEPVAAITPEAISGPTNQPPRKMPPRVLSARAR